MDNKEAIGFLTTLNIRDSIQEDYDAVELAVKAINKQIPIEHHHTRISYKQDYARESVCPSCLSINITNTNEYPKYCNECGQAIDWKVQND